MPANSPSPHNQPHQQAAISAAAAAAAATAAATVVAAADTGIEQSQQNLLAQPRPDPSGAIFSKVRASNSTDEVLFCLRHMASIARRRSAYNLMSKVVDACKELDLSLQSVLEPPWPREDDSGDGDPSALSSHPFEMLQLLSSSRGYFHMRTISPSGRNAFFANAAFEHDLASNDAMNRRYERNEGDLLSLFLHPDDMAAVHEQMSDSWSRAAHTSGKLITADTWLRVRAFQRRVGRYIDCSLRTHITCNTDTGFVSGALELLPCDAHPPESLGAASLYALPQHAQHTEGSGQHQHQQHAPTLPALPTPPLPPLPLSDTMEMVQQSPARPEGIGSLLGPSQLNSTPGATLSAGSRGVDSMFETLDPQVIEGIFDDACFGNDDAALQSLLQTFSRDEPASEHGQ